MSQGAPPREEEAGAAGGGSVLEADSEERSRASLSKLLLSTATSPLRKKRYKYQGRVKRVSK